MKLLYPHFLWFFVPWAILVLYILFKKRKNTNVLYFSIQKNSLKRFLNKTKTIYRLLFLFSLLVGALMIILMARPVRLISKTERWVEAIDIMMVLDISESMDATDFLPNRLEVAKNWVKDFIRQREGDRMGLVLFAGEAITRSALTFDYDYLFTQLDAAKLRELKQGTAIGSSIVNALVRLKESTAKSKIIVLLTDGDSNVGVVDPLTAAKMASQLKVKIYSIGMGQSDRVLIPIFAYDSNGNKTHLVTQIPSYINPELLRKIAQVTGGKSFMARDKNSLDQILKEIDSLEKSKVKYDIKNSYENIRLGFVLAFFLLIIYFLIQLRFYRGHVYT